MNDKTLITTLGRCWAFPPQFSAQNGVKMAEGVNAVLQSLAVLFMTQPGERIMRESWGAGMNDFLFKNVTDALLARMQTLIQEAILRYEPRAVLKEVIIQPVAHEPNRLHVTITVTLAGSDITEVINGTLNLNESQTLRLL